MSSGPSTGVTAQQHPYGASTPPAPPPKPSAHSSGRGTPAHAVTPQFQTQPAAAADIVGRGATGVVPPTHYTSTTSQQTQQHQQHQPQNQNRAQAELPPPSPTIPPPDPGWLPDIVREQNVSDLTSLLHTPSLHPALSSLHPSHTLSTTHLDTLLSTNLSLAASLSALESHLRARRQAAQPRLLALRALERQWRAKQAEQDEVLKGFSAPALYRALVGRVVEGEEVCRAMEESFLYGGPGTGGGGGGGGADGKGRWSEREMGEFVKRYREARAKAFLRRERKERWDEGRVGGWR